MGHWDKYVYALGPQNNNDRDNETLKVTPSRGGKTEFILFLCS